MRELKNARSRRAVGSSLHSAELSGDVMTSLRPSLSSASWNGMGWTSSIYWLSVVWSLQDIAEGCEMRSRLGQVVSKGLVMLTAEQPTEHVAIGLDEPLRLGRKWIGHFAEDDRDQLIVRLLDFSLSFHSRLKFRARPAPSAAGKTPCRLRVSG